MNLTFADVKSCKQAAAWRQHSQQFSKCLRYLRPINVDQRIERSNTGKSAFRKLQIKHIALLEGETGIESPGDLHHRWRYIDAEHVDSKLRQKASNVARAAPQITDLAAFRS